MWRSTSGLYLTRWNPSRPACLDNLVLFTSDEADEHDEMMAAEGIAGLNQLKEREPEFVSLVEKNSLVFVLSLASDEAHFLSSLP